MIGGTRRQAALATLVGTGGTVLITVVQAFLLIPLCLAYLGPHLYGSWLAATELLLWLQLLDFGIPNLLTQRIGAAVGRGERDAAGQWVSTGLLMLMGIATALGIIALAAAPRITNWVAVSDRDAAAFTAAFRIGGISSALLLLSNGVVGVSRGVQITALLNVTQITGALAGLILTATLLVTGFGIWALPLGLLGRALVASLGAAVFLLGARRRAGIPVLAPSVVIAREAGVLMPSMGAGSAGYLVANSTEIILVTTMFGPVAAVVYALTRRAMDGVRNLVDSFAWAAYGPFAHLVTAMDRHRARTVLREVLWIRLSTACFAAAVVVAVNRSFVTLLFGEQHFGGLFLTLAFAGQMIVGGHAFLANYLLRAAGRVREGSFLLAGEALVRLALMAAGLSFLGLEGAPLAAAASSAGGLFIMLRRLDRELPQAADDRPGVGARGYLFPLTILAVGLIMAGLQLGTSWTIVTAKAFTVSLAGGTLLWFLLPSEVAAGSLLRWRDRNS